VDRDLVFQDRQVVAGTGASAGSVRLVRRTKKAGFVIGGFSMEQNQKILCPSALPSFL
jgi:hypothetical protein